MYALLKGGKDKKYYVRNFNCARSTRRRDGKVVLCKNHQALQEICANLNHSLPKIALFKIKEPSRFGEINNGIPKIGEVESSGDHNPDDNTASLDTIVKESIHGRTKIPLIKSCRLQHPRVVSCTSLDSPYQIIQRLTTVPIPEEKEHDECNIPRTESPQKAILKQIKHNGCKDGNVAKSDVTPSKVPPRLLSVSHTDINQNSIASLELCCHITTEVSTREYLNPKPCSDKLEKISIRPTVNLVESENTVGDRQIVITHTAADEKDHNDGTTDNVYDSEAPAKPVDIHTSDEYCPPSENMEEVHQPVLTRSIPKQDLTASVTPDKRNEIIIRAVELSEFIEGENIVAAGKMSITHTVADEKDHNDGTNDKVYDSEVAAKPVVIHTSDEYSPPSDNMEEVHHPLLTRSIPKQDLTARVTPDKRNEIIIRAVELSEFIEGENIVADGKMSITHTVADEKDHNDGTTDNVYDSEAPAKPVDIHTSDEYCPPSENMEEVHQPVLTRSIPKQDLTASVTPDKRNEIIIRAVELSEFIEGENIVAAGKMSITHTVADEKDHNDGTNDNVYDSEAAAKPVDIHTSDEYCPPSDNMEEVHHPLLTRSIPKQDLTASVTPDKRNEIIIRAVELSEFIEGENIMAAEKMSITHTVAYEKDHNDGTNDNIDNSQVRAESFTRYPFSILYPLPVDFHNTDEYSSPSDNIEEFYQQVVSRNISRQDLTASVTSDKKTAIIIQAAVSKQAGQSGQFSTSTAMPIHETSEIQCIILPSQNGHDDDRERHLEGSGINIYSSSICHRNNDETSTSRDNIEEPRVDNFQQIQSGQDPDLYIPYTILHPVKVTSLDVQLADAVVEIVTEFEERDNANQYGERNSKRGLYLSSVSSMNAESKSMTVNFGAKVQSQTPSTRSQSQSPRYTDDIQLSKDDSTLESLRKPEHLLSTSFLADDDDELLPPEVNYEVTPLLEKVLLGDDTNTENDAYNDSHLEQDINRASVSRGSLVLSPTLPVDAYNKSITDIESPNISLANVEKDGMNAEIAVNDECEESDDANILDNDYVPSDNSDDSQSDESTKNESMCSKRRSNSVNASANNSSLLNISGKAAAGSRDDTDMFVQTSDAKKSSKKYSCIYCKKLYNKLPRHLEEVHKNEADVIKFSLLKTGTAERRKIIDTLRKTGTFKFNTDTRYNSGELIPSRRPDPKYNKKASDYKTCIKCLGTYSVLNIRHHVAQCDPNRIKYDRSVLVLGRAVEGRLHEEASAKLRLEVFPPLREDDVVRLIRYDRLLIIWGNKLCLRYMPHFQHKLIRGKLRLVGRLLLTTRQINPNVTDFASLYTPKMYDDVVKGVRVVANYDENEGKFGAPAVGMNLGTHLRQIGEILVNEYVKSDNPESERKVEQFLKILKVDYGLDINKVALETQRDQQREREVILPSIEDIKKLTTYLHQEMKESHKKLSENFSYQEWLTLSELTVASLVTFNRKRVGDIQNIEVARYMARKRIDETTDKALYDTLTPESKAIANKYARMAIRGKKNRTVPCLLFPQLEKNIDQLLENRKAAKVPENNVYLFGLPCNNKKRIKVIDACEVMRKFSKLCGASVPETLRGTELRKHVATQCSILNIDDAEVSDLANFMGHAENIHREIYRQPIRSRDVLGVSRLLRAAGGQDEFSDDSDVDVPANADADISNDLSVIADTSINDTPASIDDLSQHHESHNTSTEEDHGVSKSKHPAKRCLEGITDQITKRMKNSKAPQTKQKAEEGTLKPKRRWGFDEKKIITKAFSRHIAAGTLPSFTEIKTIKSQHSSILEGRTVPQIKTWIHNLQKSLKKKK